MQDLRSAQPNLYAEQRYREGKFYCDLCGDFWPMSHQRLMYGGLRVGVKCCYESEGSSEWLDVKRSMAAKRAALLSIRELDPPRAPDGSVYAGSRAIPDFVLITSITPSPAVLVRSGAPVAVVVAGSGFTASDTFTYGSTGITNASGPTLVSATEWDLSVQASGAMSTGKYKLTFNSETIWQAVFDVR